MDRPGETAARRRNSAMHTSLSLSILPLGIAPHCGAALRRRTAYDFRISNIALDTALPYEGNQLNKKSLGRRAECNAPHIKQYCHGVMAAHERRRKLHFDHHAGWAAIRALRLADSRAAIRSRYQKLGHDIPDADRGLARFDVGCC
jgi:hypothetical protein